MGESSDYVYDGESVEESIVRRAVSGDARAWQELDGLFRKPLVAYLIRKFRLPMEAAEDVSQEAWTRAVEKIAELKDPAKFWGWLRQIAVNAFLTLCQKRGFTHRYGEDWLDSLPGREPTPDGPATNLELVGALYDCIERLPDKFRAIIRERLTEKSLEEIARMSKERYSTSTVWREQKKAHKLLRECLEGKGISD